MRLRVVADPEALRAPGPRRPLLLGAFTISIVLATTTAALALLITDGRDRYANPLAVGFLLILTVIATHSEEVFGDETAINGSIIVVLAGAGIAYTGGPLWVPAACGLVAGLHWHHIRDRAIRKLFVNTSFTTLSALAATEVARVLSTERPSLIAVGTCGLAAVMAYWLTDNVLVALVLTIVDGRPMGDHARELIRSETKVIPFALLGFACGYLFVTEGPWLGLVGIAALLVAKEAVVFRPGREGSVRPCVQAALRIAPIVAAGALLGTGDAGAIRHGGVLALMAVAGFVGVGVLDRFATGFGMFALVLCAVAAVVALPNDGPIGVALIVGVGACGGFIIRRRPTHSGFTTLSAAMCAAMASGGVIAALPLEPSASLGRALLVGLLAGLVAMLAWHALLGLTLVLEFGLSILRSVTSLALGESVLIVTGGICGGGAGWLGARVGSEGAFALVALLLCAACLLVGLSARPETEFSESDLSGDELLDIVRSALLDVPASRLPDLTSQRGGELRPVRGCTRDRSNE